MSCKSLSCNGFVFAAAGVRARESAPSKRSGSDVHGKRAVPRRRRTPAPADAAWRGVEMSVARVAAARADRGRLRGGTGRGSRLLDGCYGRLGVVKPASPRDASCRCVSECNTIAGGI
ncbi:hypothetical protein CV_1669 [Chromobacterium violaceum ATCC 12472]|uniref:Uncharacterized protein n=1 Tax=Chromobacterium violaceum (strain ATCC 12472 / DSM 30191 / JCM 1249 / CCUG 213 / NBRC 12614 / NCIMB 9131 / NCTC 9757 / MK) TaxID=243365 RepID=Q7NXF7_CHRVO|nr:hypothetical protein CV_1669 [Chromobacterium violaceum ATCC 12472]